MEKEILRKTKSFGVNGLTFGANYEQYVKLQPQRLTNGPDSGKLALVGQECQQTDNLTASGQAIHVDAVCQDGAQVRLGGELIGIKREEEKDSRRGC